MISMSWPEWPSTYVSIAASELYSLNTNLILTVLCLIPFPIPQGFSFSYLALDIRSSLSSRSGDTSCHWLVRTLYHVFSPHLESHSGGMGKSGWHFNWWPGWAVLLSWVWVWPDKLKRNRAAFVQDSFSNRQLSSCSIQQTLTFLSCLYPLR